MYDHMAKKHVVLLYLAVTLRTCVGMQVCTFSEIPDSAGRQADYSGYKIAANPDSCKRYCRKYGWCVAAEFDFDTYGCFLYKGDTYISYMKGSVFMKQRCTEVTTAQPTTTTTATSTSTTTVRISTYTSSSFYTTLTTVGSSTATTTTTEPSRTDDRPTTWIPYPKTIFTKVLTTTSTAIATATATATPFNSTTSVTMTTDTSPLPFYTTSTATSTTTTTTTKPSTTDDRHEIRRLFLKTESSSSKFSKRDKSAKADQKDDSFIPIADAVKLVDTTKSGLKGETITDQHVTLDTSPLPITTIISSTTTTTATTTTPKTTATSSSGTPTNSATEYSVELESTEVPWSCPLSTPQTQRKRQRLCFNRQKFPGLKIPEDNPTCLLVPSDNTGKLVIVLDPPQPKQVICIPVSYCGGVPILHLPKQNPHFRCTPYNLQHQQSYQSPIERVPKLHPQNGNQNPLLPRAIAPVSVDIQEVSLPDSLTDVRLHGSRGHRNVSQIHVRKSVILDRPVDDSPVSSKAVGRDVSKELTHLNKSSIPLQDNNLIPGLDTVSISKTALGDNLTLSRTDTVQAGRKLRDLSNNETIPEKTMNSTVLLAMLRINTTQRNLIFSRRDAVQSTTLATVTESTSPRHVRPPRYGHIRPMKKKPKRNRPKKSTKNKPKRKRWPRPTPDPMARYKGKHPMRYARRRYWRRRKNRRRIRHPSSLGRKYRSRRLRSRK